MNKMIGVFSAACLALVIAASAVYGEQALKFSEVIHKLESLKGKADTSSESADRVTGTSGDERFDLQDKYYQDIAGKIVEGEGVVIKIEFGRRDRAKLDILAPGNKPSKGFNAVVVVPHKDARPIKEGSHVYFRGTIERMKLLRGLSLDIRGIQVKQTGKKK
jgi:hypothetical protein